MGYALLLCILTSYEKNAVVRVYGKMQTLFGANSNNRKLQVKEDWRLRRPMITKRKKSFFDELEAPQKTEFGRYLSNGQT